MLRVIFPNLRAALLSGAFLTLAFVIGEFTIASFQVHCILAGWWTSTRQLRTPGGVSSE